MLANELFQAIQQLSGDGSSRGFRQVLADIVRSVSTIDQQRLNRPRSGHSHVARACPTDRQTEVTLDTRAAEPRSRQARHQEAHRSTRARSHHQRSTHGSHHICIHHHCHHALVGITHSSRRSGTTRSVPDSLIGFETPNDEIPVGIRSVPNTGWRIEARQRYRSPNALLRSAPVATLPIQSAQEISKNSTRGRVSHGKKCKKVQQRATPRTFETQLLKV